MSDEKQIELLQAAKEILHLHLCEQEGLQSGKPTPQQWYKAVDDLGDAIERAEALRTTQAEHPLEAFKAKQKDGYWNEAVKTQPSNEVRYRDALQKIIDYPVNSAKALRAIAEQTIKAQG